MKTRKILLNIDLRFQEFLFFGAVGTGLITPMSGGATSALFAFALLFLGFWQLASGVIMGIILKDDLRVKYFFGSVVYLILLVGGGYGYDGFGFGKIFGFIISVIFVAIIPLSIAFWYLRITNSTLNEHNALGKLVESPDEFEDILDSEEIFKPIEK